MNIPLLAPDEQAHLARVERHIAAEIAASGGVIGFDRFMDLALYAPGLGYYAAGSRKFGAEGDFVTAPEISPFFSRCMARQCAQVLDRLSGGSILEVGAGTGTMAADLLAELDLLQALPDAYYILEVSPDLQQRQQLLIKERIPHLADRVHWLSEFPDLGFVGVVLGNELLDAMPVCRFQVTGEGGYLEQLVAWDGESFHPEWKSTDNQMLIDSLARIEERAGRFSAGYQSEINLNLSGWFAGVGSFMARGAVLLIDYGYSRREYYHPERFSGTLICHFRHRAHGDPFTLVGLQDITANVDFTAVAEAGITAGFELAGYTTQANFLLGAGLDSLLSQSDPGSSEEYIRAVQGVKQLTLPSEMGERFKVIALSRELDTQLKGFELRDLRSRL